VKGLAIAIECEKLNFAKIPKTKNPKVLEIYKLMSLTPTTLLHINTYINLISA